MITTRGHLIGRLATNERLRDISLRSGSGTMRKNDRAQSISASAPKAAIGKLPRHFRVVPIGDLSRCSKKVPYSMTSSARNKIEVDNSMPIALAVFTFTTNSNRFGCSIGISAGMVPLRIFATWVAACRCIAI